MSKVRYLIATALIVITAAVYLPVKDHSFINFDDNLYVTDNYYVKQGLGWESIKWAFQPVKADEISYWHPLTWISHMLDCQIFGVRADMHHLVNLFLHLVNVLLLFILLHHLTGSIWKSAFAAALFALHPINVDSVAWVAERKNLLSATFWFVAIIAYGYYAMRPSLYRYGLIMIALAFGLMAKSMLVTLPCVLLLLDYWPLGRLRWGQRITDYSMERFKPASLFRLVSEKVPLLALSFVAIALSVISLRSHAQMLDGANASLTLRIFNALVSYVLYLKKMIWPNDLAVFYPFPEAIPLWKPAASAVFIILISAAIIFRARKIPALVIGWLWYLGALVPVIGLVQGGLWPALADRWAYIPLIGIFIMIAWGAPGSLRGLKARKYLLAIAAIAVLLLSGYKTSVQLKYWENDYTLFNRALDVTEDNFLAHSVLGSYYSDNPEKARYHFTKSLDINPRNVTALRNFANFWFRRGDYEQARHYFLKALWVDSQDDGSYIGLGNLCLELNDPEKAAYYFSLAMRIAPNNAIGFAERGNTYLNQGKPDLAIREYTVALNIEPENSAFHYNIGLARAMLGNIPEAICSYRSALEHDPGYVQAHLKIAETMFQQGNMLEAQKHYQAALQIEPNSESIHYNLGIVLLRMNRMEDALLHLKTALKLNPEYQKAAQAMEVIRK